MSKFIIDSVQEKYRKAEIKVGELERQLTRMKNTVAYLMVGVQALGKKLDYDPEAAKACIDQFIIDREIEENERVKKEFQAKVAAGEMPEFKVINNMEGTAEIPNAESMKDNG